MTKKPSTLYIFVFLIALTVLSIIILIEYFIKNPYAFILQVLLILVVFVSHKIISGRSFIKFLNNINISNNNPTSNKNSLIKFLHLPITTFFHKNLLKNALIERNTLLLKTSSLNDKLEQEVRLRNLLLEIHNSMLNFDNYTDYLNYILVNVVDTFPGATHGSVIQIIDDNKTKFIASYGYDFSALKKIELHLDETFLYVLSNGDIKEPKIVPNMKSFNEKYIHHDKYENFSKMDAYEVTTCLGSPIFIDDKLWGIISIDSKNENAFSDKIVSIATYISKEISAAITNYIEYDKSLQLSRYDALTGILNRSYFTQIFGAVLRKSIRYKENFILAVIDVDDLKSINDKFTHNAGDYALIEITKCISKFIRTSDIFARYGGDEFVLVFFNTDKKEVEDKLDSILHLLNDHLFEYDSYNIELSFSYGLASFPDDALNLKSLINHADKSMYEFKKTHKIKSH